MQAALTTGDHQGSWVAVVSSIRCCWLEEIPDVNILHLFALHLLDSDVARGVFETLSDVLHLTALRIQLLPSCLLHQGLDHEWPCLCLLWILAECFFQRAVKQGPVLCGNIWQERTTCLDLSSALTLRPLLPFF